MLLCSVNRGPGIFLIEQMKQADSKCTIINSIDLKRLDAISVPHHRATVPAGQVDVNEFPGLRQRADTVGVNPTMKPFRQLEMEIGLLDHPSSIFELEPMMVTPCGSGDLSGIVHVTAVTRTIGKGHDRPFLDQPQDRPRIQPTAEVYAKAIGPFGQSVDSPAQKTSGFRNCFIKGDPFSTRDVPQAPIRLNFTQTSA